MIYDTDFDTTAYHLRCLITLIESRVWSSREYSAFELQELKRAAESLLDAIAFISMPLEDPTLEDSSQEQTDDEDDYDLYEI